MNRKIILILALVLVFPCCQMAAQVQMVVMGGQYNDPHNENKPTHRVPPAPIYVNQEGRCLAFDSSLVGETIKVVSDETLLYTTVIGEDGKIEIPEYIFGEVELRLVRGSLIYHVMITL
jgi:hypothetical protein